MAAQLDAVPFEQAISAMVARGIVLPAFYYNVLPTILKSYTFSVAGLANVAQLQQVLDSLTKATAEGVSYAEWVASVKANKMAIATLSPNRLDTIFRTNIQSMYIRGREEQAITHQATRPYLMIDAINDNRVRKNHLAFDGIVTTLYSNIYNSWMNRDKYKCRCSFITLSQRQATKYQAEDAARVKNNPDLAKERISAVAGFGTQTIDRSALTPLKESAAKYQGTVFEDYLRKINLI